TGLVAGGRVRCPYRGGLRRGWCGGAGWGFLKEALTVARQPNQPLIIAGRRCLGVELRSWVPAEAQLGSRGCPAGWVGWASWVGWGCGPRAAGGVKGAPAGCRRSRRRLGLLSAERGGPGARTCSAAATPLAVAGSRCRRRSGAVGSDARRVRRRP